MSTDFLDLSRRLADLERDFTDAVRVSSERDLMLARAIRRSRLFLAEQEHQEAWERLRPAIGPARWRPRSGEQLDPDLGAGLLDRLRRGDPVADTLGNLDPYVGVTNLLSDPLMEMATAVANTTGTEKQVAGGWYTAHAAVTGSVVTNSIDDIYNRTTNVDDNPFNSEVLEWQCRVAASSEANFYLYAKPAIATNLFAMAPNPPYLVGAFRLIRGSAAAPANLTHCDVYVELYNTYSSTLLATSTKLAYYTDLVSEVRRLVAVSGANPADWPNEYQLRLRVHLKSTAGGECGIAVVLGEPQLVWAYTPDAPPFSPQAAHWTPREVVSRNGGTPLRAQSLGDSYDRVTISLLGIVLGDGTNAPDTSLIRNAADELWTDDNFKLLGGFRQGGTTFPSSPDTNELFFRTDIGMWFFYDGTRWLCACPHEVAGQNVGLTWPLSADTGAGLMYMPLPDRGMDIRIEKATAFFYITGGSALSASHKWAITLRTDPGSSTVGTITIDSGASDAYRWLTDSTGYTVDMTSSQVGIDVGFDETGTPGTLRASVVASYRYIAT